MKLKVSHDWESDGRVRITVKDHDDKVPFAPLHWGTAKPSTTLQARIVFAMTAPRGTTQEALAMAKRSALMAAEIQMMEKL